MPRVLVINNYSFEDVWNEVRCKAKPDHHLYGINHFHKRNYEVRLVPFKNSALLENIGKFLTKFLTVLPLGSLDQQWSCIKELNKADLIYAPCQTQTHLLSYLRALGIIKTPIVCIAHHPLVGAGRLDRFRVPFFKLQIKGTDAFPSLSSEVSRRIKKLSGNLCQSEFLPWGPDLNYYPQSSGLGTGVVAAGRTGRDFLTFGQAASMTNVPSKIICLESNVQKEFQNFRENVEVSVQPDNKHLMYPELLEIYAKSRALAIPLYSGDSLSGLTSLMDAIGMGKPVIMTKQPFVDIDVEAEGFGVLVDEGDVAGWHKAIQFFEDNPEKALTMGKKARKIAETRINSEIFSNKVMDIFDRLLKRL